MALEEHVVHLPEFPLRRRGLGHLRREESVGMNCQREVPEDEAESGCAEPGSGRPHDRLRTPTVRTLVVPVLGQRQPRVVGADDVILLANRRRQSMTPIAPLRVRWCTVPGWQLAAVRSHDAASRHSAPLDDGIHALAGAGNQAS